MSKNKFAPIALLIAGLLTFNSVPSTALSASPELTSYTNRDWSANQWHLSAARVNDAWNFAKGEGTIVAVIDTGVDAGHPDLSGQVLDGFEMFATYGEDGYMNGTNTVAVPKESMTDEYGHGTHVAGLIAAKDNANGVIGVAPESKILPIKVFDAVENGDAVSIFYSLRDAINLAVENGADVINMSLGLPSFEATPDTVIYIKGSEYIAAENALCQKISEAKDAGVITVVAAGNDGLENNYASAPSTCADAVSVAATDVTNHAAFFSNYDVTVDIAAPGYDVLSTLSRKANPTFKYGQMSGTSMAAPITAGAIALLKSAFPDDNIDDTMNRIYDTAVDVGVVGDDASYGNGLLDLAAAVGAKAVRTSVPDAKKFVANVRNAYNEDYNSFALTWNQPLGASLPSEYVVRIYDRYGSLYSTQSVSGNTVRLIFEIPERFNYSFWTVIEAVYPDSTLVAPPVFRQGNPIGLRNVSIENATDDFGLLSSSTLSWSPIDALEADYLVYGYSAIHFSERYQIMTEYPDENGDLPSTVNMDFTDRSNVYLNSLISDFDVSLFAKSITLNDLSNTEDGLILFTHPAKNPLGLAVNINEKGKIKNTFALNNSKTNISCGQVLAMDCSKAKFQVTYTANVKSGKKYVNKTYKTIIKGTNKESTDVITGGIIYKFNSLTPFKINSSIRSVTVKVNLININGKVGAQVLPTTNLIQNKLLLERNIEF